MTTSNVYEFESTGATIVKHAFQHIRVAQKGQPLTMDFTYGKTKRRLYFLKQVAESTL